jgi:hypothetical protein
MLRIIFLLLITSASFGQVLQETNGSRADNRNVFKLGFRLPQVCWVTGNPNLLNYSAFQSKGAMVYDTCAGKIKRWSGSVWVSIQDSTGGGGGGSTEYVVSGLGIKVDSSGRAYTVNSDTGSSVVLSRQRAAATYALIGASPTGSGAVGRATFWTGANTVSSDAAFLWDNTNKRLSVGTNSPANLIHAESATTFAYLSTRSTVSSQEAGIALYNDQPFVTAAGSFNIYGSAFSPTHLRNQVAFGSRQGLLFLSNSITASGGTSPIDFYPGGNTEVQRFIRLKSFGMAMNSAGTTADPVASAILDMNSTTKGFLPPRQTTAQRNAIASPAAGLSVYNSSLATNDVYTSAWYQQPNGLTGSGTLDFPSTGAHSSSDLTITVTGAADGDIVILGVPNASVTNDSNYTAWVSTANTVTVRFNHYGSGNSNPASGPFKVYVIKN